MENREFKRNIGLEFVGIASLELGLQIENERNNIMRKQFEKFTIQPKSKVKALSIEQDSILELK